MIEWNNKSDRGSVFFDGQVSEDDDTNVETMLREMFAFLLSNIIGTGSAAEFDRLLLEVNCDTGRVLVAATTHEKREKGQIDGCSVRLQAIQDYWYDLIEGGVSDQEFTQRVVGKVTDLGQIFRSIFVERLDNLREKCCRSGFQYIVYGGEPGIPYVEERFAP